MKYLDRDKPKKSEREVGSLARRPSQHPLPKQTSLEEQALGLAELLVKKKEERRQLVHLLVQERDPGARALLRQRMAYLRQNEKVGSELLEQLRAMEPDFRHQHELLQNGRHPQENLFRIVARHEHVNEPDMFQDRKIFVWVLLKLIYDYPFLEAEVKEREHKYRTDFTRFLRGAHDRQEGIEELAKQRGFGSPRGGGEDGFRLFVSLAKDKWLLRRIEKGLAKDSLGGLLREAEKRATQAQEDAQHHRSLAAKATDDFQLSESRRIAIEGTLSREQVAKRQLEIEARKHEEQAKNAKGRLKSIERELDEERSGQARELDRMMRHREEIFQRVRAFRDQEDARIKGGGSGMRLDPDHGFLMLEAERVLAEEVSAGEWPSTGLPYFLNVLEELLSPEDFEERYFHDAGRNIVSSLNLYLRGRSPFPAVLLALKSKKLKATMLAPMQVRSPTGDRDRDLLEIWLAPHRAFQRVQYQLYRQRNHPNQERIDKLLKEADFGNAANSDLWISIWDRFPSGFLLHLDTERRKGHV